MSLEKHDDEFCYYENGDGNPVEVRCFWDNGFEAWNLEESVRHMPFDDFAESKMKAGYVVLEDADFEDGERSRILLKPDQVIQVNYSQGGAAIEIVTKYNGYKFAVQPDNLPQVFKDMLPAPVIMQPV